MIHLLTYAHMSENLAVGGFGSGPYINTFEAIKTCLENTHDHVVWVVTNEQLAQSFEHIMRKYDLEKFLVVDHRGTGENVKGTTNRNYMDRPRRLKVFVMKGAKA